MMIGNCRLRASMPEHQVTPYRLFDKMVVTVRDPVSCGQQPIAPGFSIPADKLFLSYALSLAYRNVPITPLLRKIFGSVFLEQADSSW
jgi:hypothetical protein